MLTASQIVDLANNQVQCDTHGLQQGMWCCRHILQGAPAAWLEEPQGTKFGQVLCTACKLFMPRYERLVACCARCVDYHVRKPIEAISDPVQRACEEGALAFTRSFPKGALVPRNPYANGSPEAWAWDLGWRCMVSIANAECAA